MALVFVVQWYLYCVAAVCVSLVTSQSSLVRAQKLTCRLKPLAFVVKLIFSVVISWLLTLWNIFLYLCLQTSVCLQARYPSCCSRQRRSNQCRQQSLEGISADPPPRIHLDGNWMIWHMPLTVLSTSADFNERLQHRHKHKDTQSSIY